MRVEDICHAALERDAADRTSFVASACAGDEALRREVEALLAHADSAEGFLVAPIGELAAHVFAGADASKPGNAGPAGGFIGRQVGTYQILSRLGAGGMGEVYRARDAKLGRDVAIKVLPPAFTADRERLARFDREARLLASLNHPHIGAIYGVEAIDGQPALILELIEGETLAARLKASRLPIAEALAIARQIGEALEAAHERGIVHRDLKPANITITPAGTVKVLDFGLAKPGAGWAGQAGAAGADLSQSPTFTVSGTQEGVLLGTAAYMSPEQARGKGGRQARGRLGVRLRRVRNAHRTDGLPWRHCF